MSSSCIRLLATSLVVAAGALACAPRSTPAPAPSPRPTAGVAPGAPAADSQASASQNRRAPRPYAQVVTGRAVSDSGAITVHRQDGRWLLELSDSLAGRDFLMVGRIAAVPPDFGGFLSAGTSVQERLVRWERDADRVILRVVPADAVADPDLPIARSVAANYLGAILGAFPVLAYTPDGHSAVIDVTDFFSGDTPALSGLDAAQRTQYQVRRLDPARSYVNTMRSYPLNIEVRHTQTFEAGRAPSDANGGSITLEMRQSLVLLPAEPMRPRYADPRAGFFTVERVNYGLDVQKAATESFITRWRLEPSDPAAYARGELVEPVKPIVYYIDPATPTRWRPYVKQGVEDWQKAFEKAGFRNAIIAREPPSAAEDPTWDPEDIRHSVVRWAASTTRNAVGPSTVDPRTGEIIESDITWYHNHMRSYRNRLMVETGAANPAARSLDIPEELMGETMRQVITHEVGHALGLPHNMIASSSFPVDSLRSPTFTRRYGVSATIMDYARQNYVAQPGDGLAPVDFIRHLGPFDDFIIEWGYRRYADAPTAQSERPTLNRLLVEQTGPMRYRYLPQQLTGIDPRSQTEDVGDDPVAASGYAIANLERVIPELREWTATAGEDFSDLAELHGEAISMWSRYMGHVVSVIGGVHVDPRSAEETRVVYTAVPRRDQERALSFLSAQVFTTPSWLLPDEITSRIGPVSIESAQAGIISQLLDTRRLDRVAIGAQLSPGSGFSLTTYMAELRRALWGSATVDQNQRVMQRVYVERLAAILAPPTPTTGAGGNMGARTPPPPIAAPPNIPRSDLPALARSELTAIRSLARGFAASSPAGLQRAHWQDMAARIDNILEPSR